MQEDQRDQKEKSVELAQLKKQLSQEFIEKKEQRSVSSLTFDANGELLLTGSYNDRLIRVWNSYGAEIKTIELPYIWFTKGNNVIDLAISRNKKIIAGNSGGYIQMLNYDSGKSIELLKDAHDYCTTVKISDDDRHFISRGKTDNIIKTWDLGTGKLLRKIVHNYDFESDKIDEFGHRNSLAISHNGKYMVSGHYKNVCVWDVNSYRLIQKIKLPSSINEKTHLTWSPLKRDFTHFIFHMPAFTSETYRIANVISNDDKFIISASDRINIFDMTSGKEMPDFKENQIFSVNSFSSLGISSNDRYITVSMDRLYVHDLKLNISSELIGGVTHHVHNSKGQIAAVDENGTLFFWDFNSIMKRDKSSEIIGNENQSLQSIHAWLLRIYMDILSDPEKLSIDILELMFRKINNIAEFKFPFTLAVLAGHSSIGPEKLQSIIFECLNKLISNCVFDGVDDQKLSSHMEAINIAKYKVILDSVFDNGLITKSNKYYLEIRAEDEKTFSDDRFVKLDQQIICLKKQVKINYENIKILSKDLANLKEALRKKFKRDILFSIAKIGLAFLGSGLIDCCSSMIDFSSLSQLVAAIPILNLGPAQVNEILLKGIVAVKEGMGSIAESILKLGCDPDELFNIWVDSAIELRTNHSMQSSDLSLGGGDLITLSGSTGITEEKLSKSSSSSGSSSSQLSSSHSSTMLAEIPFSQTQNIDSQFEKTLAELMNICKDNNYVIKFRRSSNYNYLFIQFFPQNDLLKKSIAVLLRLLEQIFNNKIKTTYSDSSFIVEAVGSPLIFDQIISLLDVSGLKFNSSIAKNPLAFLNTLKSTSIVEEECKAICLMQ